MRGHVPHLGLEAKDMRKGSSSGSGTIPAGLGSLFALTHLDLSDNA